MNRLRLNMKVLSTFSNADSNGINEILGYILFPTMLLLKLVGKVF